MNKKFDSGYGLFSYCKGILKNKGNLYFVTDNMDYFKSLCLNFYNLDRYSYKLEDRNLIGMVDILIKAIGEANNFEDIGTIHKIIPVLASFIGDDNPSRENYPDLYPRFEKSSYMMTESYITNTKDENGNTCTNVITLTDEFLRNMNSLSEKCGVYMFMNELKEPLYIGKSKDLSSRIPTSFSERNYPKYLKYALTKTQSDMSIYEIYYIAKYKPVLNTESNYNDALTIELPDLEFSDIIKTREDKIIGTIEELEDKDVNLDTHTMISDGINNYLLPNDLKYRYKISQLFINNILSTFGNDIANNIIEKACYKVLVRCVDGKNHQYIMLVDFDRLYTIFKLLKLERYYNLIVLKDYCSEIKYFAHENMWSYYGFNYEVRNTNTLIEEYDNDIYEIVELENGYKSIKLSDKVEIEIELNEELVKTHNSNIMKILCK